MVLYKCFVFLAGMLLVIYSTSIKSFGVTFIDECDSVNNSEDAVYEDFNSYESIEDLFLIKNGMSGNCIYSASAADTPSAFYGVYSPDEVRVTLVSANSTSVFTNPTGEKTFGKSVEYNRYHSSDIFVSDNGVAFFNGLALGFDHGYEFKQPFSCNKCVYLGVNVFVLNKNGKLVMLQRKLDNIRTVPKIGGGFIFVEDYYWKVPPSSAFVKVTLNGYTNVYDGDVLRESVQKKPYAITKVQISGERMEFIKDIEIDEDNVSQSTRKKRSSKNSNEDFVVEVESESHTSTTENVTIYDEDTIVQNVYPNRGSGEGNGETLKKQSKTIEEQQVPISAPQQESVFAMVDSQSPELTNPQDNHTWKIAGVVYIGVSSVMLFAALLVKRAKKQ